MGIDTQIYRIKNSVRSAYSAVQTMDGELPEVQNVDNLAAAIKTIPKGSAGTTFTTDETLTMSPDNVLSVTTPTKSATKTEFDTMTNEQKKGLVIVTDEEGNTGGGGSTPNPTDIYSTEEVRIGTWIDGKPLYRRVLKFRTLGNNTTGAAALLPVEYEIMDYEGFIKDYDATNVGNIFKVPSAVFPLTMARVSNYVQVSQPAVTNSQYTNRDCYLIIKYTKTTDEGGTA